MAYADVPAFYRRLGEELGSGEGARIALRLLILTAARTSEVLNALKAEFDLDGAEWTIPAERMKAGRAHRIPLPPPAVTLVRRAFELSAGVELVFPGARAGRPLSNMSLLMLMRRAGLEAVPHGFRSSFRDWAGEATGFPPDVVEMALAHNIGSEVERAYARSDLFEKRRQLMSAWASFVTSKLGSMVVLTKEARRGEA